jgi:hypothetical protein
LGFTDRESNLPIGRFFQRDGGIGHAKNFNLSEPRKIHSVMSERSSIPVALKIKLRARFGNQKPKMMLKIQLRIPKGFNPSAQGCEERATLGDREPISSTLNGLNQLTGLNILRTDTQRSRSSPVRLGPSTLG